jgi:large subunit ribosomal protein L4
MLTMLEVQVYDTTGKKVDTIEVDEGLFGSEVNVSLLKQAIVAYHANKRQRTAQTKSRGMVAGSTRKLYRQKGTGNARRGPLRTNIMKGGGVTFAKLPGSYRKGLPRRMRKAALDSAILAKLLGEDLMVVDGLKMDAPRTGEMAHVMRNLKINRSCLLALAERDSNIYLSSRNIPDLTVRVAEELNAFDVATRRKMLVTTEAMKALMNREADQ